MQRDRLAIALGLGLCVALTPSPAPADSSAPRAMRAARATRIEADTPASERVGGPDAVAGIGDWALSNGHLCAAVADPAHEGYVLPTGGSLVDLGHCGRDDDQFVILEGLGNLSRSEGTQWYEVTTQSGPQAAHIRVRGERDGVEVTTRYELGLEPRDVLRVTTRLERKRDGARLFAFGDAAIHYEGTLRSFLLAREGRSEGFAHRATGDAKVADLIGSITPIDRIVLIGSPAAEHPISYALRITGARLEQPARAPRAVPTFGLSTDTVSFIGALVRPPWLGSRRDAGLLQLAQSVFMDLDVGEALVFEREVAVAARLDATAFTDARHPEAPLVRASLAEADARLHVQDAKGSAMGFAAPAGDGSVALRLPPGRYRAQARASGGRRAEREFEVGDADVELGAIALEAPAVVTLPARIAPARIAFRGIGDTPDPVFGDDHTAMVRDGEAVLPHAASHDVVLGGFAGDPSEVVIAPGHYRVHATRGPEFGVTSTELRIAAGERVDLELDAPQRVLETPGWISADLHVHAAPSDDSTVPMRRRLASFVAEGGEILVSTDHDNVSDYAPLIERHDLRSTVRSIVGLEITSTVSTEVAPRTAGHSNVFPLPLRPAAHRGGAIRSEGRRLRELIAAARAIPGRRLIQLNHAREPGDGSIPQEGAFFTHLSVGREYDPERSLEDEQHGSLVERDPHTGVRDLDFDAMELLNGPSMPRYRKLRRDWFSLLLQGEVRTATGNSDTHSLQIAPAVPRNYVAVGDDRVEAFDEAELIGSLLEARSFATTGPILLAELHAPDATHPTHRLTVALRSAPWVPVSTLRVFVDGALWREEATTGTADHTFDLSLAHDAFVTVEAEGEPGPVYADLLPDFVPFAFTNALRVDVDGDGRWQAPGLTDR